MSEITDTLTKIDAARGRKACAVTAWQNATRDNALIKAEAEMRESQNEIDSLLRIHYPDLARVIREQAATLAAQAEAIAAKDAEIARMQHVCQAAHQWFENMVHGRDSTDEGFSIARKEDEEALFDAVRNSAALAPAARESAKPISGNALAEFGAAAVECQHGYDVCPICDALAPAKEAVSKSVQKRVRVEQGKPVSRCSHDRLDEDGICRACGEDCRGA